MENTPEGHGGETVLATARGAEPLTIGDRKHLLVFSGSASWLYQIPSEGQVVIGRSETADLRIDDASVSRQHARLAIEHDGITITDLGSQNGTFVNNVRIEGAAALHPNDVITIQKTTLILHTTSASGTAAVVLGLPELRERLTDEIDRAVRYERNVTLLCLCFDTSPEPRQLERLAAEQLRRIDSVAWSTDAL